MRGEMNRGFGRKSYGKDHLEDPDLDKILISKCILGIGMGTKIDLI